MWLPGRKEAGPRPEGADVSHRRGAGCCAKPFTLFLTGRLPVRPASPVSDRTPTCPMPTAKISRAGAYVRPAIGAAVVAAHIPLESIQIAIATIIRFSVSEMKPRGTLLPPPMQAHLSSRLSI